MFVVVDPSLLAKIKSVKKDGSEIKFVPNEALDKKITRVSRQSHLYTPVKYQYQIVPVSSLQHSGVQSAHEEQSEDQQQYITQPVQETYQTIDAKQQEQLLAAVLKAAQQPKSPIYHATPLRPFGALLNESPEKYEKTVLVTPKPVVHQQESADEGEAQQSGGHSFYTSSNSVGKITDAVIQEPKHAPLVYQHQSLQSTDQHSLHHHEDHEEPKSVSKLLFNK